MNNCYNCKYKNNPSCNECQECEQVEYDVPTWWTSEDK